MSSALKYSLQSPAQWEVSEDQLYSSQNVTYWSMRMTDLSYLLIQRFHEHVSNDVLESAMLDLPPPDWNNPESLRSLFDKMSSIWSRVDANRRAPSLLEDRMLRVVLANADYGLSLKADYEDRRKEAKRQAQLLKGEDWEEELVSSAKWIPPAATQRNLWDIVANRLANNRVVYQVPPDRILIQEKKSVKKVSAVFKSSEEPVEASNTVVANEELLSRVDEMLGLLSTVQPVANSVTPPSFKGCTNCGGRHFQNDFRVDDKCVRRINGKWNASNFYEMSPKDVKFGTSTRHSTVEGFWRALISKYYPKFATESEAVKEKFFKELAEEAKKRKPVGQIPSTGTNSAAATSSQATQPKKSMSTMRLVNVSRPRVAPKGDEDTLIMYIVDYLDACGAKHTGWHQYDPGSMLSLIRKDVAVRMGLKIIKRRPEDHTAFSGILPDSMKVTEDAVVKLHLTGARRVLELPTNPDDPTPMVLGDAKQDIYWEQKVPCVSNLTIPFLMGGQDLKGLNMQQSIRDGKLTFIVKGKCYAVPYISWELAMSEMQSSNDRLVLNCHAQEIEENKSMGTHTGLSKNYVLHGQGMIPIQVGPSVKKNLRGWVQVEIDDFVDTNYPIVFEPTLCQVTNLHIDAHTSLEGPVCLPAQCIKVKIIPVVITPTTVGESSLGT
jgi:hypothetical protein